MSVTLRKRKNGDGTTSLILDIYSNGKRKFEFLKECKLVKPVTPSDRLNNKEKLLLANKILHNRSIELESNNYDLTIDHKKKVDFISYFENYLKTYGKKDARVVISCFKKFIEFLREEKITALPTNHLDENLLLNFKEYLEQTLNGGSPAAYFKQFKKVIKQGIRDKVFSFNPAQNISIKENQGITKEILTFEEIKLLAKTECSNLNIKNAFLFSCLTGLRHCDIISLKWQNINGEVLRIIQQKTNVQVSINLNQDAIKLLETSSKDKELVFLLPSHSSCLKNLKTWCKRAGIGKKITWHCARHSFATNIIFFGSDLNSASSLLGHSSFKYTQKYVRVVESLKEKAVQNLPSLNLTQ